MRTLMSFTALAVLAAGASAAAAAPGDRIGQTVKVVDLVTATLSRETRTLAVNDGVRQSELIEVGQTGTSEIKLNDDTKLALGPGASLLLDKFVYDPDRTANAIVVNLAKGAFRFITGIARKPAYVIRVPSASITVRGTIFDVFVQETGQSWVLLHEGAVRVCNDRGKCREHDEPGKLIAVNEQGEIGNLVRWASLSGSQGFAFDDGFPFVASPPSVDPNPVFTRDDLVNGKGGKPGKGKRTENEGTPEQPAKKVQKADTGSTTASREEKTSYTPPKVKPPRTKKPKVAVIDPPKVKTPKQSDDVRPGQKTEIPAKTKERIVRNASVVVPLIINRIRERNRNRGGDDFEAPQDSTPSPRGVFTGPSLPRHRPPMGPSMPSPKPHPKPM